VTSSGSICGRSATPRTGTAVPNNPGRCRELGLERHTTPDARCTGGALRMGGVSTVSARPQPCRGSIAVGEVACPECMVANRWPAFADVWFLAAPSGRVDPGRTLTGQPLPSSSRGPGRTEPSHRAQAHGPRGSGQRPPSPARSRRWRRRCWRVAGRTCGSELRQALAEPAAREARSGA